MKIKSFIIDEYLYKNFGLERKELKRLGNFVALFGRNGSGKTRFLNAVIKSLENASQKSSHYCEKFIELPESLRDIGKFYNSELLMNYVLEIKYENLNEIKLKLENSSTPTISELIKNQKDMNYNEVDVIKETAWDFIENLVADSVFNDESMKLFEIFKGYVKNLLGKDITCEKEKVIIQGDEDKGGPFIHYRIKIDGTIFQFNKLSPGEKILFYYCVLFLIHEQNNKIKISESIIIIDEPELHLHPDAQIKLINGIKRIIGNNGQCWIASHSINILSYMSFDEIYLIKKSAVIEPSSLTPGETCLELMGVREHIEVLNEFTKSISKWAYSNFIMQCFNAPDSIEAYNKNDPQVEVFKKFISDKDHVRLLDFGAGKGRFAKILEHDEVTLNKIGYHVMEREEKCKPYLLNLKSKPHIYNSEDELPENYFDIVLLCNVLHEIHPNEWSKKLNILLNSINANGYLVILEDNYLPKGERPNEIGYLIPGIDELKLLFGLENNPGQIMASNEKYKDRILCAIIAKDKNPKVTDKNIIESIILLKENVYKKIVELNEKNTLNGSNLKDGRLYALFSQMYINTENALRYFDSRNLYMKKTIIYGHIYTNTQWKDKNFIQVFQSLLNDEIKDTMIIESEIRIIHNIKDSEKLCITSIYILLSNQINENIIRHCLEKVLPLLGLKEDRYDYSIASI